MGWTRTPQLRIRRVKEGRKKTKEYLEQLWELRDIRGHIVHTKWEAVQVTEDAREPSR